MFSRLIFYRVYNRSTKSAISWRAIAGIKRCVSSLSHHDETISLPVGGNGTVNLTISRPTQPASNNNVLVYLPPGPLPSSSSSDFLLVNSKILRYAFPTTTIVDIQYRISLLDPHNQRSSNKAKREDDDTVIPDHRFPTPVHDVFTAWDYVTDRLELYNHDVGADGERVHYTPKICLLGSHIGGALALSLALTNPESITAVAILDGVVDWVGLDDLAGSASAFSEHETAEQSERSKKGSTGRGKEKERAREREAQRHAAKELMQVRRRLFRSHSGYFDAFASPVLFLRAPGRDTPVEPMRDVSSLDRNSGGVMMRYGDGNGEVTIIEDGTGGGEAYGPYDDDWHSHLPEKEVQGTKKNAVVVEDGLKGRDKHARSSIDSTGDSPSLTSSSTETDSIRTLSPLTSSPRRRKVLRRWPPTAHPEDVLLPYVNIFTSTTSSSITPPQSPSNIHNDVKAVDLSPVLNLQATELQELLRKACFWGRERGLAEERVNLTRIGGVESKMESKGDQEEIFGWLRTRFGDS